MRTIFLTVILLVGVAAVLTTASAEQTYVDGQPVHTVTPPANGNANTFIRNSNFNANWNSNGNWNNANYPGRSNGNMSNRSNGNISNRSNWNMSERINGNMSNGNMSNGNRSNGNMSEGNQSNTARPSRRANFNTNR